MISGEVACKSQGLPLMRPMRYQFHLKHLMWLVFGSAMLCDIARVEPRLAISVLGLAVFASLMFSSAACGASVTRSLLDSWTKSDEDRVARPRIEVKAKTAAVVIGLAAAVAVLVFGMVILSAIVFFLRRGI